MHAPPHIRNFPLPPDSRVLTVTQDGKMASFVECSMTYNVTGFLHTGLQPKRAGGGGG
jgi:hypothetical protein